MHRWFRVGPNRGPKETLIVGFDVSESRNVRVGIRGRHRDIRGCHLGTWRLGASREHSTGGLVNGGDERAGGWRKREGW